MLSHRPFDRSVFPMMAVAAATALVGCTDEAPPPVPQEVGTAASQIAGGTPDTTSSAVVGVELLTQFGVGGCTGSLLTPNLVLTALHCVGNTPQQIQCPGEFFGAHDAGDMYVTLEPVFPDPQSAGWRSVREIVLPPFSGFCGRDVALLIITSPISANLATPLEPRTTPIAADEIYTAIGYGQQGEGGPSGTRYRRDNLTVLCNAAECGAPGQVYPKEWVGDTGVCSGDSGGPALDAEGKVAGVASRGAVGCEQPVYGEPYGHLEWIRETAIYAAGINDIDPPAWATDDGAGGGGGASAGAGGGSANGFVAGNQDDKSFDGEVVGSCTVGQPGGGELDWSALLIALGAIGLRTRRQR